MLIPLLMPHFLRINIWFRLTGSAPFTRRDLDIGIPEVKGQLKASSADSVSLSLNGQIVAFGRDVGRWIFWDVTRWRELRELTGFRGSVESTSLSSDGLWLASSSDDGRIKLWDLTTGSEIRTLSGSHDTRIIVNRSPR